MRFFFIALSVAARSELIACALLDKLKRNREDYQLFRLRVVSNFGDGDCGAGEIHTRTRARNFEETRREGSSLTPFRRRPFSAGGRK